MVGHADEKRSAISPDDREPERNSRKISRRVGSESALKTASGEAIVSLEQPAATRDVLVEQCQQALEVVHVARAGQRLAQCGTERAAVHAAQHLERR